MSGKPYPEGVTKVLSALARLELLETKIDQLEKLTVDLQAARTEYATLAKEVTTSLEKMDLSSQGNFGFGGRMGWFLAEMRRQIHAGYTKLTEETT